MDRLITHFNAVLLLLLLLTTIVLISNNFLVFGQSNGSSSEQMSTTAAGQMNGGEMEGNLISSVTEWIGIFALGIVVGLLSFNIKISDNVTAFVKRRKIILSIAILS